MTTEERIQQTHAELSPTALRFIEYARANDELLQPGCELMELFPTWLDPHPMQRWPVFVGKEKLAQIERGTAGVLQLVKLIPERIFQGNLQRMAEFYQVGSTSLLKMLLAEPNGIAGAVSRCDFVDDGERFLCVEVNYDANLGGWDLRYLMEGYLETSAIAHFFNTEETTPRFRDAFKHLLAHLIDDNIGKPLTKDGDFNIAFSADKTLEQRAPAAEAALNILYTEVREEKGLDLGGRLLARAYGRGLEVRKGRLYAGDTRVHAFVECANEPTPQAVFRCFKSGAVSIYNGPVAAILNDKRNLALLSEHAESDRFDDDEKSIIRDHIPWTRELSRSRTIYQGEAIPLVDFSIDHRERLVLKTAHGFGGEDVFIGRSIPADEWRQRIRTAAEDTANKWLIQEFSESRPYLFQNADGGCSPHKMVWGTFCFGKIYGGGFLRMMPLATEAWVINSAQGARESIYFEV